MNSNNEYFKFLEYASACVSNKEKTIAKLTELFNVQFGEQLTPVAFESRLRRYRDKLRKKNGHINIPIVDERSSKEFEEINDKGEITSLKIVEYSAKIFGDQNRLLDYLGYDHSKWSLKKLRTSVYQQRSNKSGLKDLYAVQFTVEPKNDTEPSEYLKSIQDIISDGLEPRHYVPRPRCIDVDDNLLMEIAPIELHLGKLSHSGETGQDYDLHIAENKFYDIFERIIDKQSEERCGSCLLVIGSDFFNSESDNMTTGKTPQQNDTRYKKLMQEGFRMYVDAINMLTEHFNRIDVLLCSGNHARAMEFFLYFALRQYFKDYKTVSFRDDYKDTQAYHFGNCGIFFNHGDVNLKRTISSIPSEFFEIWGKTLYRELHMGHLHKEVTVDDEGGMITRRIGSPCATDAWHYQNRFVGAVQKHEIFVWNRMSGLKSIYYINTQYQS